MDKQLNTDEKEKIVLPENLQREMMKFFLQASAQRVAKADKEKQQTPKNAENGG